jgi:hypothetical protein
MKKMLRVTLLCALALAPIGCGAPTVLPHVAANADGTPRGSANISSALPAAAHRVTSDSTVIPPTDTLKAIPI